MSRRCLRPNDLLRARTSPLAASTAHDSPPETRAASAAQDPMVAVEALLLIEAHRAQSGANGSASRSEDRARDEHSNLSPDAFGEQWREGEQNSYHLFG